MELSSPTRTNGASALTSTTPTPLAQLSPSLDDLKERHIRATVILLWPYSSYTKQFSLLFSEPDFRLRDRKGQVRVNFRGASAEAVSKSQVGIGDTVVLSLDGALWQNHDSEISTPGKSIDWDLTFSNCLLLEVYRDSELFTTIKVEAPLETKPYIDSKLPMTPKRSFLTPQTQTDGDVVDPLAAKNWPSPAFSQKFSISFGSHSNSPFNPLEEEDGYIWGKGRKRTKFNRPSSEWVFVDTLPSPPPAATDAWEDEDLELEEPQDITKEGHPSQGDTVPNSQATVHVNDEVQKDGTTLISEPTKLLLQTESMDNFTLPVPPSILGTFNTTFDLSQTEGSTATFTQKASWDTTHSQQPTITPFSSFGSAFEQEQPLVSHEAMHTPLPPDFSPGTSIVSSLQTPLADTRHNLPPSRSPPSSQLHVYDTMTARLITPKHGVELTVDETGCKDEAMVNSPEDLHYMPGHPTNSLERPSSLPLVIDPNGQKQFDHEIAKADHVVPFTSVAKCEGDITGLHKAERQASPTVAQDLFSHGYRVDQEIIDEDGEGEEEIEEYIGGMVRERLEEGLEEHVEETNAEMLEEKISRRPTEDLEEELVELEEEMEERLEEELAEDEQEEDMEVYSDDETGRTSSDGSSLLESEEVYDEGSEVESEEDTFPLRPTYLAVSHAPPEVIVLDSDDEDERGPIIPSAPQQAEIPSSDVTPAPSDLERGNLPRRDQTPVGFVPHGQLGEGSHLEVVDFEVEPTLSMQNHGFPGLEPTSRHDEPPRGETSGYMAEAAIPTEAEPLAVDSESEDEARDKSENLNIARNASPIFFSGSMSNREPEAKHDLSNEVAIDPQLYQHGKQENPKTDSETRYSVDRGLSHDGVVDVDNWEKPTTLGLPDSKGPPATPIETRQSADIPSSPPSPEAHSMEDELITSQIFRDMEEQARRQHLQATDLVNEMPLPASHPTKEEEPRTPEDASVNDTAKDGIDLRNGKPTEHANAIRKAAIESRSILQPNTNATGLRSRLSYFFPLSTLADNFNKMADTISLVISCSKISQSRAGPREYYTTLHLTDPSMSGITVCAQIFRRTKSTLPIAEKGHIILLRDFKVQSMDHRMMLLSVAASAWAVFREGSDADVQMNGSPVEFGPEEQEYIATLRQWYQEEGEQLAEKHEYLTLARGSTETSSSISSATSGSPSRGKGSIFKKFARPKKSKHRRITIHKLRDGRRYAEVGSPADKEMIHELRDGTLYANL